jgi:hypothetical protein
MAYAVGVGLTNECNLRCPHCYHPDIVIKPRHNCRYASREFN